MGSVRVDQCAFALIVEMPRAALPEMHRFIWIISKSVRCYYSNAAVKVIALITLPAAVLCRAARLKYKLALVLHGKVELLRPKLPRRSWAAGVALYHRSLIFSISCFLW
jgi:hypothetical protein